MLPRDSSGVLYDDEREIVDKKTPMTRDLRMALFIIDNTAF